jgi:SdrD B-like domain
MSKGTERPELHQASRELLQGPLKHAKAAALAAALVPLASVMATPASAQALCGSGGICGFVWYDTDNNGIQDAGELGAEFVKVYLTDGTDTVQVETDSLGFYYFFNLPNGTYTIYAALPPGTHASPAKVGTDDTIDSDGAPDGTGKSVAPAVVYEGGHHTTTDFGLFTPPVEEPPPGTGTPGFWKNHPEAWPVDTITVGGVDYTMDEAIEWLKKVGKDKTTTMFSSLVPAMLNVLVGNDGSCVGSTITAANAWMAAHGPVGSSVSASSDAWAEGEPLHKHLDAYNNGLLCATHRQ